MKLYKFKSLEGEGLKHALDMLVNERIFLPTHDMVNDPEEGWFCVETVGGRIADAQIHDVMKAIQEIRFTCFTREVNNPLLWAHYAGGFKGVAFEYNIDEDEYDVRKIYYGDDITISQVQARLIASREIQPQDAGILKTKKFFWVDEKEYRLYQKPGVSDPYVTIKPSKVLLGYKQNDVAKLFKTIADMCKIDVVQGSLVESVRSPGSVSVRL